MDFKEMRQRWERNLVQAAHFAETDNLTDAVARAQLVLTEVEAEQSRTTDPETAAQLELMRTRVARAVAAHQEAYRAWDERVRTREATYTQREEEVYSQPLPVKGLSPSS